MLKRAAYITSAIIHPGIMSILSFTIIAIIARGEIVPGILDSSILLLGVAPAWFWHFQALHRRKTIDYYQVKGYHKIILPLISIGLLTVFLIYIAIKAPSLIIQSLTVIVITTILGLIINRFWKISQHAGMTMMCAALFIPISGYVVIIIMCLSILTGLSRLQLQVHTPLQVIAGWIYGFGLASLLTIFLPAIIGVAH